MPLVYRIGGALPSPLAHRPAGRVELRAMKPPPVTHVYIAACRSDFHLTRTCVASVRHWYPDIPISLVVDENRGKFDTSGLERDWNVGRFETPVKRFGIGFSKLELLVRPGHERYLALDSDTVLTGPVLDAFNEVPGDFVVHPEYTHPDDLRAVIFDPDLLAIIDPAFGKNRIAFNCGHYVGTSGLLRREDFDSVLEWTEPRTVRRPDIFKCYDQGVVNYVLQKAETTGRLVIGKHDFHLYVLRDTSAVTVAGLAAKTSPPFIMHWAGLNPRSVDDADRPDVLKFFQERYRAGSSEEARRIDRREERSPRALTVRVRRALAQAGSWLAAKPAVWGDESYHLASWYLHHFYWPERRDKVIWLWSEPEAGIDLHIPRCDAWVRIEAGSPFPASLEGRNLRFFINGKEIAADRVRIGLGVAEFVLQADELRAESPQHLSWTIDRLEAPGDKRRLGMPVSGVWVSRPRGLPGLARLGLGYWMEKGIRKRERVREALRTRA